MVNLLNKVSQFSPLIDGFLKIYTLIQQKFTQKNDKVKFISTF